MRSILLSMLLLLSLIGASAQTDVKSDVTSSPDKLSILQPSGEDVSLAAQRGLNIFKILPRGMIREEKDLGIRGGGAYYSFTTRSHSYNEIPQLSLEKGFLQTAFYGANYGFLSDLGEVDIRSLDLGSQDVAFLKTYTPPRYMDEIRKEQAKSHNYDANGVTFKNRLPAITGHTYAVRSISFREADTLVLFTIYRINQEGSAIVLWKPVHQFEIPAISYYTGAELRAKVTEVLDDKKFAGIMSEIANDDRITVRGKLLPIDIIDLTGRLQPLSNKRLNIEITPIVEGPSSK